MDRVQPKRSCPRVFHSGFFPWAISPSENSAGPEPEPDATPRLCHVHPLETKLNANRLLPPAKRAERLAVL